ncbi:hypothetical protein FQN57_001984 [Myotisia sp. PD_48]|nr:hypothetical protein FQN57_001984 [Myotisia sp. PD_48]
MQWRRPVEKSNAAVSHTDRGFHHNNFWIKAEVYLVMRAKNIRAVGIRDGDSIEDEGDNDNIGSQNDKVKPEPCRASPTPLFLPTEGDPGDEDYVDGGNDSDLAEMSAPKRQKISSHLPSYLTQRGKGTRLEEDVKIPKTLESGRGAQPTNPCDEGHTYAGVRHHFGRSRDRYRGLVGGRRIRERMRDRVEGRVNRWTADEDTRLSAMVKGNRPWSEIREHFPHQTESSLRQRLSKVRKANERNRNCRRANC